MNKRLLNVDAFLLNIDEYDENVINDFINTYFGILSEKLGVPLKFKYTKTDKGYTYEIERYATYQLAGNHVIDVDCALITGLEVNDFRIDPIDHNHHPKTFCMLWYDGYYTPADELARFYKALVGSGDNCAKPKRVKIHAYSTKLEVIVEYNDTDIPPTKEDETTPEYAPEDKE